MKKIKSIMKKYRFYQIALCGLITISIIISAIFPIQLEKLINEISKGGNFQSIMSIGMSLIAITIIYSIMETYQNYRWQVLAQKGIADLRENTFKAIFQKGFKEISSTSKGVLISKIMDDVNIVAQVYTIGIPMILMNTLNILVIFIVLLFFSIELTLMTLVLLPIYYIIFNILNGKIRKNSNEERKEYANITSYVEQTLNGIDTIKINGKDNYILNNFKKILIKYFNFAKIKFLLNSISTGTNGLIVAIIPVLILVFGSFLITKGRLSLGGLIAYYTFMTQLYEPITNLSDAYIGFQTGKGMSHRIEELLIQNDENNSATKLNNIEKIEFKNVNFSYDEKKVFENLNFAIEKGDKVSIVGESGKGKTTLIKILTGLYNVNSGEVLINDININEILKESLYENISYLGQQPFIMNLTLKENIIFGEKKSINEDEILFGSKICNIEKFIIQNSLDYIINNNGANLSGGEKQRICLLRTILKEHSILILDEATSALDYESEEIIVNNLKEVIDDNKIIFIITHRKKLLELCNKSIVIE